MELIHFYIIITVLVICIILVYAYFYKSKNIPKVETLFTDALNAMVSGNNAKATNLLRNVVKQDSNHVRAYLQLGNILRKDNPNQALKIHQSLTVRPNLNLELQSDIHRALAKDYMEIGDILKSQLEAKKVLKIEKRNLWAIRFLIQSAEKNQSWDEAASWTKQLTKVTGRKNEVDEAKFDVYRGLDCLNNGNVNMAESLFKKAINMSPEYNLSYKYLGDLYDKTRDLVKALEYWEIFAKKDIVNGKKVYAKIESALFDLGRYSEVEKFYRNLLELDSSNFEATIRLANVLEEKGESGAALDLVENALKQNNTDVRGDLMKLKLSISTSTPIELSYQIDSMIEKLSVSNEI